MMSVREIRSIADKLGPFAEILWLTVLISIIFVLKIMPDQSPEGPKINIHEHIRFQQETYFTGHA